MANYLSTLDLRFASRLSYPSLIHQIYDSTFPVLRTRPCTICLVDECRVGIPICRQVISTVFFKQQDRLRPQSLSGRKAIFRRTKGKSNDFIAGNGRERFLIELKFIEKLFCFFNFSLVYSDCTIKQIQIKDFYTSFQIESVIVMHITKIQSYHHFCVSTTMKNA